jgi:tetratricopeptide (TPR) repeat protein
MKHERAVAYGAFAIVCIVWGTTYLGIAIALETVPPLLLTGSRFVVAGLIMLAIARLRGEKIPRDKRTLANLALVHERRGDLAAARATFEKVLRLSPTHAVAAVHLARMDRAKGDREGAARRLDAMFAAGGGNYDALVERADLWLQEGRPDKAIPLLEEAVRGFPGRRKGRELLERAKSWPP